MTKKEIKILMGKAHNVLVMDYHAYLLYKKDWLTLLDDTAFSVWNCQRLEVLAYVNLVGRGLDGIGEDFAFSDDVVERWL